MYVQGLGLAYVARQVVNLFFHGATSGVGQWKLSATSAGSRGVQMWLSLKLLVAAVDICVVRRSALVAGLSLALCGLALVGIGEWAAGRFENAEPDGGSSVPPASSSTSPRRVDALPAPLPVLPDTSDHLPAHAPGYTFRRDIDEVRLQFTVADEQGRVVNDLTSEEVRVFDDQTPVTHFNEFERDDNRPLQIGLLLDTSDSVRRVLPEEKAAATKFLQRVLRPQTDTAFVMGFGGDVKVWQTPTANSGQLLDAIARLQEPGWGTRFYDALYSACNSQVMGDSNGKVFHRALVVLSDGDDTQSLRGFRDVIGVAMRGEVQIYALTIRSGKADDRGDLVLRRLTDTTGGRVYVAASSRDLDSAFEQIEQDLRTQYYVSFSPTQPNPGFHSLRVEIRAPEKLQVHARLGYYATAE